MEMRRYLGERKNELRVGTLLGNVEYYLSSCVVQFLTQRLTRSLYWHRESLGQGA